MRLHTVALDNLRRRRSRAAFLVVGLLVGIGTVVTLLTLSSALTVAAQNDLENYGANIVVVPRTDDLSLAYGGADFGGVAVGGRVLRDEDAQRILGIPNRRNIAIIAPELLGVAKVRGRETLLMGVRPGDQFRLKGWWEVQGRPLRGEDEVVAGSAVAGRLGLGPGDTVDIGGQTFTVSGVLRPTGSEDDELVIADLAVAQRLLDRPGEISVIEVAALCSDCPIEELVAQIGAALPETKVTAMQQVVENRMHALEVFRTFSYVVAGVIIGIEGLVVFVTMMGSVNARTREIGIFRALGFRRSHVTGLILMEAGVASVVAGALGYLAGMGISYVLLPILADGPGVVVAWRPDIAAGAIVLGLAIGSAASLYPALHASRLDPTVALRSL